MFKKGKTNKIPPRKLQPPKKEETQRKFKDIPLDSDFALPPNSIPTNLPMDVVTNLESIPTVSYVQTHPSFQIFITDAHSPTKFWFINANDAPKSNAFMDEMHTYYRQLQENKDDTYRMSAKDAIEGRLCVALFDFVWHRAIIVRAPIKNKVQVMHLDYGTISTASIDEIQFLTEKFAKMPYLLMRGRLALVAPRSDHWAREYQNDATEKFIDLVFSKKLYAILYAQEEDENVSHLILYEKPIECGVDNTSINEQLALATDCRLFTSTSEEWPCIDELYPTFDMLENHKFPTYTQLVKATKPEIYWRHEKTAAFYSESHKSYKRKWRTVYSNPFDDCFAETGNIVEMRCKTLEEVIASMTETEIDEKPHFSKNTNPFLEESDVETFEWTSDSNTEDGKKFQNKSMSSYFEESETEMGSKIFPNKTNPFLDESFVEDFFEHSVTNPFLEEIELERFRI
ncbi:uncharacterized protein LOC134831076 [Culicoides brevitarsis]|uniref:uncharacterized protein LOC134831076 n=1 Tax=Culicoides brevitarsis TaxID=469753 RepID=UPI00307BFFCC